jgi:hypothetical protein
VSPLSRKWTLAAERIPPDQKQTGSLVVQDELWDPSWGQPGVLVQDPESGTYRRKDIAEALGPFFPSVSQSEKETYPYPLHLSDRFWQLYAEDVTQFVDSAHRFADMVRALGSSKAANQMTAQERSEFEVSTRALAALTANANPTIHRRADGSLGRQWMSTSLLASYATMALLDARDGLLNVCDNCGRVFVSSAGRARFCSPRCRKSSLQREWRARKAKGNE